MNLSGILVVARTARLSDVTASLNALPGVEIHHVDEPSGRMIVIQEAGDINAEVAGLRQIKALPHVVMAEMVFHYIAEDEGEYTELPAEPSGQDSACGETSCSVPAYLMD